MLNNKDTYTINEEDKVIINDRTKEEHKFTWFCRHFDKSTLILLINYNWIIIEADGTLFSYNDQIEFRFIRRRSDESTIIKLDNDYWITIKKDEK